jgi:hypothetical protein
MKQAGGGLVEYTGIAAVEGFALAGGRLKLSPRAG